MGTPLVMTFDVGTQSARCILVRPDGDFEDVCKIKYEEPYFSRQPGWAEQTPNFYYDQLCKAGQIICARNADKMKDVIAVTSTVIRSTFMCLDKDNKPLRDIIVWLDKRKAVFDDPLPTHKQFMLKAVGMEDAIKILYTSAACNWIKQNEKEVWANTAKYVVLPTYLNYKMTGVLKDSQANIIGHIPYDYKNRRWAGKNDMIRAVLDVPMEKLCDLVPSGTVIGHTTEQFAKDAGVPVGLPLIATGSDKGCETLGLSVFHENQAAISLGTTVTVQLSLKKYVEPQPFIPAYPAIINDLYNPEMEIFRGMWLVSWFIKEFGYEDVLEAQKLGISPEELLNDRIADLPPCCDGLMLQPYWTPGVINPNSRGAIIGFSDYHTRYHMYRAILEGLAFEMRKSLSIMEHRAGTTVDEVFLGGGGSQSDVFCQILADVLGIPTKRIQTHEASSIGSSMVAFVAQKVFTDYEDASKHMVHETSVFTPNPVTNRIYMDYYNSAYNRIYGQLEPIYRKIIKIVNRKYHEGVSKREEPAQVHKESTPPPHEDRIA